VKRLLPVLLALGCAPEASDAAPLRVVGSKGAAEGRFVRPRGMARAPDGTIYVVDKTGRIQKFSDAGVYQAAWSPPDVSNGQPVDLTVGPDGNLYVCDTHQFRILVYAPDGRLLRQWGSHGTEPGQFVYPVGIAFGPTGELFVSEYGENDRIQVFTAEGRFLRQWGSYGEAPGQFQRPQDLVVGRDGRVFVADAANHRIQVFTPDGALEAVWGRPGAGPGELSYPYGLGLTAGGDLIVCEYGNNRLQRFHPDGRPGGTMGRAGAAPGDLNTPWDIEVVGDDTVIVVDTENHRLQYLVLRTR
jgi:DNA-binding beta-propeller fold protein YncE